MSTTNIHDSFDYAVEESKKAFQANIASLNELSILLRSRISEARTRRKRGIFLELQDADTIVDWIEGATVSLLAEYIMVDRVNRKAMKLYNAGCAIERRERSTYKHLQAADRALTSWEDYKASKITAKQNMK